MLTHVVASVGGVRPVTCLVVLAAGLPIGTGCEGSLSAQKGFATQRLPHVSPAEGFPAAQAAFRQYFAIASADATTGRIVSRPTEADAVRSQRVRDVLGATPSRRRFLAELVVLPDGKHLVARCRVLVQRLDTAEQTAFAPAPRGDDRPTDTFIDREASVTPRQNEYWSDVGRDRELERQVLASLRERVLGPAGTQPAAR